MAGLLRGTGTQVRHVELRTPADLRHPALADLLREAAASQGWVAPAAAAGRARRR